MKTVRPSKAKTVRRILRNVDTTARPSASLRHRLASLTRALRWELLLVALAYALAGATPVRAETPEDYRGALAATLESAEGATATTLQPMSLAGDPALGAAADRLESIDKVTTPDGTAIPVDNRTLINALRGSRDDGLSAIPHLRRLLEAIDDSTHKPAGVANAEAKALLSDVLARPEFRARQPNAVELALEALRSRVFQWLENLIAIPKIDVPFLPPALSTEVFRIFVYFVLAASAFFAIAFIVFSGRSARRSLAKHAALQENRPLANLNDARTAMQAADTAAAVLDFRSAVHYLFLWAVLLLSEQSRLRFDRSLTNRELLQMRLKHSDVEELLSQASTAFDRIWYGHDLCSEAEYSSLRRDLERIVTGKA